MDVEKDWAARFSAPTKTDRKTIIFVAALCLAASAVANPPLALLVCLVLTVSILLPFSVSFILRKLGRKPLTTLGIALITIGTWTALFTWWAIAYGNQPCDPCS